MSGSGQPGTLRRAIVAGSLWGLATAAGLTALDAWQCGFVCLSDAALLSILYVVTGILTIGPVVALFAGSSAPRAAKQPL
jgi:hypothetical protein